MIGNVKLVVDPGPHCGNGWEGRWIPPLAHPVSCNYTGGHFCTRKLGHDGDCVCVCDATHPAPDEERRREIDSWGPKSRPGEGA